MLKCIAAESSIQLKSVNQYHIPSQCHFGCSTSIRSIFHKKCDSGQRCF